MTVKLIPTARADAADVIAEVLWHSVYNRDHSAAGTARNIASRVVLALRREGLITGTHVAVAGEVLDATVARAAQFGEKPARGISHLVAQALVLIDLPVVQRDVIASLMPDKDVTKGTKTTVAMALKRALRQFHKWKWIDRRDDDLIAVLDRESLTQWFEIAEDVTDRRAQTTLNIAKAVATLNAQIAAGDVDELRRQQLHVLQRLMETAPGSVTNERGKVRLVSKPRIL